MPNVSCRFALNTSFANLQETLGISWYEGALVDAIPMVPDRLSYSEMAVPEFKYRSEWTKDFDSYTLNKSQIVNQIRDYIENYNTYLPKLAEQRKLLSTEYFNGKLIYEQIKKR